MVRWWGISRWGHINNGYLVLFWQLFLRSFIGFLGGMVRDISQRTRKSPGSFFPRYFIGFQVGIVRDIAPGTHKSPGTRVLGSTYPAGKGPINSSRLYVYMWCIDIYVSFISHHAPEEHDILLAACGNLRSCASFLSDWRIYLWLDVWFLLIWNTKKYQHVG